MNEFKLLTFSSDVVVPENNPYLTVPQQIRAKDELSTKVYGNDLTRTDMLLGLGKEDEGFFALIVDNYDIGNVVGLRFPHVVSTTSRKAIVETDRGVFFLKEKPKYCCDPDSLTLTADFQSYLADRSSFVAPVINSKDQQVYTSIGTRIFLLTEFREGRVFRGNMEDVASAGDTLAQIHNLSNRYPHDSRYPEKLSFDESTSFIQMAAGLPNTEQDPFKETVLSRLKEILARNRIDASTSSRLLHIICHGDFSPFNMVFGSNSEGIIAVNDFDNCGCHPRIRDLAESMLTFCDAINYAGNTSSYRRPISRRFNLAKAQTLFQAYSNKIEKPLSSEELAALPREMKTLWIELMALGLVRGDFNFYDVLQALKFPDFIDEHIDNVLK